MFNLTQETGNLPIFSDERGVLFVAEAGRDVPFDIKRIFFIKNVPKNETRGNHVYKYDQLVILVSGRCKISVFDIADKTRKNEVELSKMAQSFVIPAGTFRTLFDFSEDCILAVLNEALYSEEDYSF